jgi:hypothetical protein
MENTLLNKERMLQALTALDGKLDDPSTLIIGGGGAMVLAYNFPLSTHDIDAVPKNMDIEYIDRLVKEIAKEQGLPGDWLNPYYSTFTYCLPKDYLNRVVEVFKGKKLLALALGKEEMLLMKCFAHRAKDIPHAKYLIKIGADPVFVEKQIEVLQAAGIGEADRALEFLDDILDGVS